MPYQVQVYLAVAPEPSLGPRLQADLSATLAARIEAVIGPAWNVTLSPAPAALGEAMLHGLAELPGDRVPLPAAEVDKILLVSVTPIPGGLTVAARDFDVRTRTLSPAVVRPVWQPGMLGNTVLDALVTAFAPLGQIDRWEKDVVFIRAKASALPLGDRRLAMFREGDVLRPIVRYNDREGRFRRAAAAQWSFCVVEKVSPEEIKCRVHTGMRGEVVTPRPRPGRAAGAPRGSARRLDAVGDPIADRAQAAAGRLRHILLPARPENGRHARGADRSAGAVAHSARRRPLASAVGPQRQRSVGSLADGSRFGAASDGRDLQ